MLVLGGTAEARELADALEARGHAVTTSLAGRTRDPRLPAGAVRTGGFGGVEGLVGALGDVDALIDATHPFAARMTEHAAEAARATGTPMLVLRRPGWVESPGDRWIRVPTTGAAAAALGRAARVFLAIGRQGVHHFVGLDAWFLVRAIEPPDELPARAELILRRGPFELDDERALLREHRIDVLVAKDSGGATEAKLVAAREAGVPVVLVDRPALPTGVAAVGGVEGAVAWVEQPRTPPG
ncbi:cobalt-precorrin-6A reductase [Actinomycetospora termitidis]|uniref:Cobalt-precorrin-6A reductase n=1 Tax=Actinomycetospora termitidis TaxID=3053470 RepID=A0ABT7MDV5_9PSEU|nr:cobalt-precorrin-6A reductase [Actinomycetospora sp. Odt1-22]MDL5158845.1 cobalt-precorrin-6A reductase [Actinomycetospora sp. Odt1-22]